MTIDTITFISVCSPARERKRVWTKIKTHKILRPFFEVYSPLGLEVLDVRQQNPFFISKNTQSDALFFQKEEDRFPAILRTYYLVKSHPFSCLGVNLRLLLLPLSASLLFI